MRRMMKRISFEVNFWETKLGEDDGEDFREVIFSGDHTGGA